MCLTMLLPSLAFGQAHGPVPADREADAGAAAVCDKPLTPLSQSEAEQVESVHLTRRNWENHGTDIHITGKGRYTVTAAFLGRTKQIRDGILAPEQLGRLLAVLQDEQVFEGTQEYAAPFKTPTSWWGYDLSITTAHECRHVRFHSEDDTVPPTLKDLIESIMTMTQ